MIEKMKKEIVGKTLEIALYSVLLLGLTIMVAVDVCTKNYIFAIGLGLMAIGTAINIATSVEGIKIDLDMLEMFSRIEEVKDLEATVKGFKKEENQQCGT